MQKLKITLLLFIFHYGVVQAQKKPLDHSVYDNWTRVGNVDFSKNGKFITYQINPQEGDGTLFIEVTNKNSDKIIINRGYNLSFTPDEKYAICLIKPLFQETRKAKIKKKKSEDMPKDSLAIISLTDNNIKKFPNVLSYKIGENSKNFFGFISADSSLISQKERSQKDLGKPLIIYNIKNGNQDTIKYVSQYAFDKSGHSLVAVVNDTSKKSSAYFYQLPNFKTTQLATNKGFISLPQFDENGEKLLYVTSTDTASTGTKKCNFIEFERGKDIPQVLIDESYTKNLPENWSVNQYSEPYFSKDGNHIFIGIAPEVAPNDTSLVPFETAGLDIWNYNSKELPPVQLKNLKNDIKRTYLTFFNKGELMPLTTSKYDKITPINEGNSDFVLSIDETKSIVSVQWNDQNTKEISIKNIKTGNKTAIAKGVFSYITVSPDGNYVTWFNLENSQWYIYSVKSSTKNCITDKTNFVFADEEEDRPEYPYPYGAGGWTIGDESLLLYDRYDIWQYFPKKDKIINLTNGTGRKTKKVFRYAHLNDNNIDKKTKKRLTKRYIETKLPIILNVFDKTTKENGFATISLNVRKKNSLQICLLDTFSYNNAVKADDANIMAFEKGNFTMEPNLYVTSDLWKNEEKLTNINPQRADYIWGNVELFKWKAYDGMFLEGMIYKPENFDVSKKYPVILYFYEKNSDNLYWSSAPSPSRSIINIPYYVSNGYVVFVPDIVYKVGHPGESAYNCIVSGAEALAKNTWIDKNNMAIQGQSWGGYQVAYLVTRTNMFKAAEAGAPVSNMTSAYGGIRWESGVSRQFQYEHTQSRIGKTLWNGQDLYIENSPVFHADKVQTPLLIMHNDADGAVPWYQGIEYFMALRRLGKPVWMLEYNNEAHNLKERRNMKDLTVRMQQFFDYYLKGKPEPAWMKTGIPAIRKGQYFGLEDY